MATLVFGIAGRASGTVFSDRRARLSVVRPARWRAASIRRCSERARRSRAPGESGSRKGRGSPSSTCRRPQKAHRSRASTAARASPARESSGRRSSRGGPRAAPKKKNEKREKNGKGGPQVSNVPRSRTILRQFRGRALRGDDRAHRPHLGGRQAARSRRLSPSASIAATRNNKPTA